MVVVRGLRLTKQPVVVGGVLGLLRHVCHWLGPVLVHHHHPIIGVEQGTRVQQMLVGVGQHVEVQ
jgi:hypothetical protein